MQQIRISDRSQYKLPKHLQVHTMLSSLYLAISLGLVLLVVYLKRRTRCPLPLPPGPKRLPLLGNFLDMPTRAAWLTYDKWFKELNSEIVYLNLAGTHVVVLNTYKAAVDLFEKRSAIYSSRIGLTLVRELMGWDFAVAFMPYGHRWRVHRRVLNAALDTKVITTYEPQIRKCSLEFLLERIGHPEDDVLTQIRHMSGALILLIAYGLKILPTADPFIALGDENLHNLSEALQPGAFWVVRCWCHCFGAAPTLQDFLPWLKYVPEWFPGAGFQRKAKKWKAKVNESLVLPFDIAKRLISKGNCVPSFVSASLDQLESDGSSPRYDENIIREIAGTMYAAGIDTLASTVGTLVLALAQHPDVQQKAQAELEYVLKGSLPTFEDQDHLPYLTAVVLETLRWKPITP